MESPPNRQFAMGLALVAALLAAIPFLLGLLAAPEGGMYLSYQYATDDHMVYAAWMRQAMEGRFLFDNRFTTDPQPGLTFHLYFLLLGWIAKLTGIALASNLSRIGFTFLFVLLLDRFLRRLELSELAHRLALGLAVFGGGLGFAVWHTFGEAIVTPSPLSGVMLGRLPTDTWQPEGFAFPSMLTNGLFMVSLCLILLVFESFLAAKDSGRAVLPGALTIGALMNIHSYDVLLVALVLVGFLAAAVAQRRVDRAWILRAALITLGVVPAAAWFLYVLKNDPVFQARAATDTFSPNFRTLFFGYFPLLVLGLTGLGVRGDAKQRAGLALTGLLIGGLFLAAPGHIEGYFLTPVAFGVAFVAAVAAVALLSGPSLARNLIVAWAVVGLVAVYFPGLFQRKLAMGLAVPWGLLGGIALADLVRIESKVIRTAAIGGLAAVCSLSSLLWLRRELLFIQANVSRTSVHGVFLTPSATAAIAALDREPGRRVVAAPPGVASPLFGQGMQESTSSATLSPIMPDLNPIASGLTGAYSIAGHWSETPRYNARRGELSSIFYSDAPVEARVQRLRDLGVTHVIAPNPAAFPALPLADFAPFGRVISEGDQFRLIALR